jgi:hypothetical protein
LQQGVQHGQQEGCGLAAAGLAGDHQVGITLLAFGQQGLGDHLVLHLRGLLVAKVGHCLHQLGGQTQAYKTIRLGGHFGGLGHRSFVQLDFVVVVRNHYLGREIAAGFKRVAHVRPCASRATDRIKRCKVRPWAWAEAPGRLIRSWLQNINHQTGNAPWARCSTHWTPGAIGLFRLADGGGRGRLTAQLLVEKRGASARSGDRCERQMHKSAQFPVQPAIIADFPGKP